jgi:hypothetical protein
MNKIDRRRNYYLMVDTETCNGIVEENGKLNLNYSLVYDLGLAIIDKHGTVYEQASLVISDTYYGMKDLMKSCYYAEKLPRYDEEIKQGQRQVVSYYMAQKMVKALMEKYETNIVIAHNAGFDNRATNNTQRYLTKSKYRYFFPYGTEIWDTLKMANDTICKQKTYIRWCEKNGYMTNHATPRPRATAEILYRYISGEDNFIESHTGLEDVMIEKEIFAHCMRQHKPMRKKLFEN